MDFTPIDSLSRLQSLIAIANDSTHSDAQAKADAWKTILAVWASGSTVELARTLASAQTNEHAFVRGLLQRVFMGYLGPKTNVVGYYECENALQTIALDEDDFNVIQAFVECACLRDERKEPDLWADVHHPPEAERWTDTPPDHAPTAAALEVVHDAVQPAATVERDIDFVVATALRRLPEGVLGHGRNAETRAYLFCRISSAYVGDMLTARPSPLAARLVQDVHNFTQKRRYRGDFVGQTTPILRTLVSVPRDDPHEPPSVPPFWLFLVHLASARLRAVPSTVVPWFRHVWSAAQSAPPSGPGGTARPHISQFIPVFWTVVGLACSNEKHIVENVDFGWLCAARLSEVDGMLGAHEGSLVSRAWTAAREPFARTLVRSLASSNTEQWRTHLKQAVTVLVDLYRCDLVTDEDKRALGLICLRLVALCVPFTAVFEEVVLEDTDRALARDIFASMIKWLNPFPTDDEKTALCKVQRLYTDAAYRSTQPADALPPHLADRAVLVFTALARLRTPLAQAACDAGLVMLLRAMRDGWYPYAAHGPAEELQPPAVRAMLRARAIEDAFQALSERMYLAAQASRVRQAADGDGPLPAPAVPPPRVRRRPSWMATGG